MSEYIVSIVIASFYYIFECDLKLPSVPILSAWVLVLVSFLGRLEYLQIAYGLNEMVWTRRIH